VLCGLTAIARGGLTRIFKAIFNACEYHSFRHIARDFKKFGDTDVSIDVGEAFLLKVKAAKAGDLNFTVFLEERK